MLVLCDLLIFSSAAFFKFDRYFVAIAIMLVAVMFAISFEKLFPNHALSLTRFVLRFSFAAAAAFFVALLIFIFHLTGPLTNWKLQEVAKSVSIDSVTEASYLFADTPVGLRVTTAVRLSNAIALDQFGLAVVEAMKTSMHITPQGPFEMHGYFASTTFDGLTFDELTSKIGYKGVVLFGTEKSYIYPNDKVRLPAGVYKISKVFLLNGLYFLDRSQTENPKSNLSLCKHYALNSFERAESKETFASELDSIMRITAPHPWAIKISGGISNRFTGIFGFEKSSPLQYRYEHARWQVTLDSLVLPSCKTLEQEARAAGHKK